jgi:hypothetical protein
MKKVNIFDLEIQSDEIGAREGSDWINDTESEEPDEEFIND